MLSRGFVVQDGERNAFYHHLPHGAQAQGLMQNAWTNDSCRPEGKSSCVGRNDRFLGDLRHGWSDPDDPAAVDPLGLDRWRDLEVVQYGQ